MENKSTLESTSSLPYDWEKEIPELLVEPEFLFKNSAIREVIQSRHDKNANQEVILEYNLTDYLRLRSYYYKGRFRLIEYSREGQPSIPKDDDIIALAVCIACLDNRDIENGQPFFQDIKWEALLT